MDSPNYFEDEEGIECFHIGDVFTTPSEADNTAEVAEVAAAATHRSNKKKRFVVGASVIALSLATIITAVVISRQKSTHKKAAASLSTEETPWWACLTKEACFSQAELLGFTDEDLRDGDYSYESLYGCFSKNGLAYWGEGGTMGTADVGSLITTEFSGGQRIWCYDVNPNPELPFVDNCEEHVKQPTGKPSYSPSTSFRPSFSSQPTPIPSISLRPSISSEPSASPSTSEPSSSPSISSQPSTSSQPSDIPSISSKPSTSPTGHPSSYPSR